MDYYNKHLKSGQVEVLDASAALEVTEFRFFELAFQDWHGRRARESVIERHFVAYMFADRVPSWARHFARKVLKLNDQGRLDPKSFGIFQPLPSSRMRFIGKMYTVILLLIFLFVGLSILQVPDEVLRAFKQCYFPPCY
jgi:hypothetical protein